MNIKNKKPITPPFSLFALTVSLSDKHLKCGGAKEKAGHEENAHYLNETHTHTQQQKDRESNQRDVLHPRPGKTTLTEFDVAARSGWQTLSHDRTTRLVSYPVTHTHKRAHTSAPQCKHARRLTRKGAYWHNVANVHTQTHEGVDPIREGNH